MRIFTVKEVRSNESNKLEQGYELEDFGVSFDRFKVLAGVKAHIKVIEIDNELIVARKLDATRYEEVASKKLKEDDSVKMFSAIYGDDNKEDKMQITVERTFELGLLDDMVGSHMYFGSTMRDIQVSKEFVAWIKEEPNLQNNNEYFKKEVGYKPTEIATIIVDGDWYERKTGACWMEGYELTDDKTRCYEEVTKASLSSYKEYRNMPKEEEFAMHNILRGSDM